MCREAPVPQLRGITKLLQAHADSHHVVVAHPSICRVWEDCSRLSEEQRGVAKKIRGRYSELAELQAIVPVYAQVIAGDGPPRRIEGVWQVSLGWIALNGLSAAHLVCEDLYDCELTKHAARDYLAVQSLARLTLTLENVPGGGGNTHRLLDDKAIVNQRVTLCIVDSDRDEPTGTGPLGDTATKCKAVAGDGLYEMSITPGRELENHIPARLIDKLRTTWQGKQPSTRLAELAALSPAVTLFADLKSGIKRKDIDDLEGASEAFWRPLIPALSAGLPPCCAQLCTAASAGDCKSALIAPLHRTLLRDAKLHLDESSHDPKRSRAYLPSSNDSVWLKLGALVAAYGLSVKVTPGM